MARTSFLVLTAYSTRMMVTMLSTQGPPRACMLWPSLHSCPRYGVSVPRTRSRNWVDRRRTDILTALRARASSEPGASGVTGYLHRA